MGVQYVRPHGAGKKSRNARGGKEDCTVDRFHREYGKIDQQVIMLHLRDPVDAESDCQSGRKKAAHQLCKYKEQIKTDADAEDDLTLFFESAAGKIALLADFIRIDTCHECCTLLSVYIDTPYYYTT